MKVGWLRIDQIVTSNTEAIALIVACAAIVAFASRKFRHYTKIILLIVVI